MDRDGMEMHVRVGGQWISLDTYRERKKAISEGAKAVAFLAFLFAVAFVVVHAVMP